VIGVACLFDIIIAVPRRDLYGQLPKSMLERTSKTRTWMGAIRVYQGDFKMRHALGAILLLVVGSANAATIVYSSPGVVTGIGGLDIGGTLYNVDFEATAYSTFGGEVDFWSTANEAITASGVINAILTAEGDVDVNNEDLYVYHVIWGDGCCAEESVNSSGIWAGTGGIPAAPYAPIATAWSVVPVPAAVWLFGSALAGLGWFRRRQTA
jgi:hypothetical protein